VWCEPFSPFYNPGFTCILSHRRCQHFEQTSEPKSACYIETSNIDGETNLKLKEACSATGVHFPTAEQLAHTTGEMEYELPNDRIHNFTGKMKVNGGDYVGVGARNMVLRGCTLRNTKWVLGLGESAKSC
jgi:magnesium-transporting ATPase (P-type)